MKKFIFLISVFFILSSKVCAYDVTEEFYYDQKLPNMYITKIQGNNERNGATFLLHRSDSKIVYCIDPFTREIDGVYSGYIGYNDFFGLTKDQINRMNLISYYGYGYKGHTDLKWYGISQYLIWETLGLDDIYFTDSYYGNRITLYEDEIKEINSLIDNHYVLPNFGNNNYNFGINESHTLIDINNVLENYEIEYDDGLQLSKNGNELTIYSEKSGTYNIKLIKKSKVLNDYILYSNETSQNMFFPGKYDDISTNLTVSFYNGSIEVNKKDRETITTQGNATFNGAIYGLYEEGSGELIDTIILDNNGYGIFKDLLLKKYYIQEIQASNGYKLDDTKYYVNLTTEKANVSIDVYEDIIKNKIIITKLYGNKITNNYKLESNVEFELYDITNNYINTYVTDNNGEVILELPYGEYILKQTTGIDNYTISDQILLKVNDIDKNQSITIKDDEIIKYGKLEINKKGSDGLLLDGVKFKVYASENITSLNGDIYYKKDEQVGEININNGYGSLDKLYYGDYYLVETESASGYALDEKPIYVNIQSDLKSLEIINKKIDYDIPNTGKNDSNYLKVILKFTILLGLIGVYEIKNKYFSY